MEKLVTNYHTHTKRCGHAYGEDEDFVLSAIKYGIKELGFSDHISFKNISAPYMRQDRSMLSDYISSISHLKEKYKVILIHNPDYLIRNNNSSNPKIPCLFFDNTSYDFIHSV